MRVLVCVYVCVCVFVCTVWYGECDGVGMSWLCVCV